MRGYPSIWWVASKLWSLTESIQSLLSYTLNLLRHLDSDPFCYYYNHSFASRSILQLRISIIIATTMARNADSDCDCDDLISLGTETTRDDPGDTKEASYLEWWKRHEVEFPKLAQMARDIFSIPSMSAEVERLFSSAKLMLPPTRNSLQPDGIEASECIRSWVLNGIVISDYFEYLSGALREKQEH